MTSHRDAAFEAFYQGLADKGGIAGRDIMRKAWDAGRRYEAERIDNITRRRLLGEPAMNSKAPSLRSGAMSDG